MTVDRLALVRTMRVELPDAAVLGLGFGVTSGVEIAPPLYGNMNHTGYNVASAAFMLSWPRKFALSH